MRAERLACATQGESFVHKRIEWLKVVVEEEEEEEGEEEEEVVVEAAQRWRMHSK